VSEAGSEYIVQVLAGPYDDEFGVALTRAGIARTGGHSSHGNVGEGGKLPEVDVHTLVLTATDEEAARAQVKNMLDSISRPHTIERVEARPG
jgi:hypothetical protein